jgi:hypothetical protein
LFRITVDKLVLFEPCYEINTNEGRQRMDALGYIKNIDGVVEKLGGVIVEKSIIKHTSNPLNPTVCFVIKPPSAAIKLAMHNAVENNIFSVPGSNLSLTKLDNYFFSNDTGLAFPVIKSIPILKSTAAILTSALCR